jgi:hypothetical protein
MIDTEGDTTLQDTAHASSSSRTRTFLNNASHRRSAVAADKGMLMEYDEHLKDDAMDYVNMHDEDSGHHEQDHAEANDGNQHAGRVLTPLALDHSRFKDFVAPTSDDVYKLRPLLVACVLSACLLFAAFFQLQVIFAFRPSTGEEKKEVMEAKATKSKSFRGHSGVCDEFATRKDHESQGIEWSELKDVDIGRLLRAYPDRFKQAARRGIPAEYRWRVWKAALKFTEQEIMPDYNNLCKEASQYSEEIRADLHLVFSDAPGFDKEALYRLLNACTNLHPEIGYCQGIAFTLGHCLWMSCDEKESLGVFRGLMFTLGLSGFYKSDLPLLKIYTAACEELIIENLPKLWEHLLREGINLTMYLEQWFLNLFIDCLPLAVLPMVWDNIICSGLPMILSIAVAILQALEEALLAMRYESLVVCLHDLKAYESDPSSVQSYSIGQVISRLGHISAPPRHILEYLPVSHWSGDMQGKCPSGHPMIVFLTPHDKFACDMCRKIVAKDSPLNGCRTCNFDMCQTCYSERQTDLRRHSEEAKGPAITKVSEKLMA